MIELVKILPHQSLFDLAIQEYGTIEAAIDIALFNDLSVTEILEAGTEIKLPPNAPTNQDILNYYHQHNLQPATAYLTDAIEAIVNEDEEEGSQTPPIYVYTPIFSSEF